ncbi:hypothetical protein MUP77_25330, partial [Candidatus Bathyarchaeota archaeon]|nr:hypothetical protein [Candidatus Bathyarchaeota archaeon]
DAKKLPNNINLVLQRLSAGSFMLRIAHDDLDRLGNIFDRAAYKLLLGLMIASIVVGMSLIVLATQNLFSTEALQIIVLFYVVAIFIGVFSVVQLIRSRDKH